MARLPPLCYGFMAQKKKRPAEAGRKSWKWDAYPDTLKTERTRTRTVSPSSRRAADISQSDPCQSEPCQSEPCQSEPCQPEAPEAAAPCAADRQRRQRSASPRMQPWRLESSPCLAP